MCVRSMYWYVPLELVYIAYILLSGSDDDDKKPSRYKPRRRRRQRPASGWPWWLRHRRDPPSPRPSRGQRSRPRRRSRQRSASGWPWRRRLQVGGGKLAAADVRGRPRRRRPLRQCPSRSPALPVWTSSSPRPSPQEAPAACLTRTRWHTLLKDLITDPFLR